MHFHVSALDFLIFAAYFAILKLLLLLVISRWPDSAIGRAVATLA